FNCCFLLHSSCCYCCFVVFFSLIMEEIHRKGNVHAFTAADRDASPLVMSAASISSAATPGGRCGLTQEKLDAQGVKYTDVCEAKYKDKADGSIKVCGDPYSQHVSLPIAPS